MRHLGLALITIGFLAGALIAVLDPDTIVWRWFVPSLGVGVAGVLLVQVAMRREATDTSRLEADFQALDERLRRIVDNLARLDADKSGINPYDLPARIDAEFPRDILAFVEARDSIAHAWGSQAYADVMSNFAAGERYLNRVWSCAADGYIDEAQTYIARAHEQFGHALASFEQHQRVARVASREA